MDWTDWLTLGIACLGAALGVINTYQSVTERRTKLRVTPHWAFAHGFSGMSIEVCNLSAFPVVVKEIGFTLGKPRGKLPRRLRIPEERIHLGQQGPVRIGARETASITFGVGGWEDLDITKAYAMTSDGHIAFGTAGSLRQFIARGNKPL